MNFVYILRCADDTLYTGWTNDLKRRLAAHNGGKGAKYTRNRRPVLLAYCELLPSKGAALSREAAIKRLSRAQKLSLCAKNEQGTRAVLQSLQLVTPLFRSGKGPIIDQEERCFDDAHRCLKY